MSQALIRGQKKGSFIIQCPWTESVSAQQILFWNNAILVFFMANEFFFFFFWKLVELSTPFVGGGQKEIPGTSV